MYCTCICIFTSHVHVAEGERWLWCVEAGVGAPPLSASPLPQQSLRRRREKKEALRHKKRFARDRLRVPCLHHSFCCLLPLYPLDPVPQHPPCAQINQHPDKSKTLNLCHRCPFVDRTFFMHPSINSRKPTNILFVHVTGTSIERHLWGRAARRRSGGARRC